MEVEAKNHPVNSTATGSVNSATGRPELEQDGKWKIGRKRKGRLERILGIF